MADEVKKNKPKKKRLSKGKHKHIRRLKQEARKNEGVKPNYSITWMMKRFLHEYYTVKHNV
jgi:hypothetical protein